MKTYLIASTALLTFAGAPLVAQEDPLRVAFLAASSQNGYNQAIYSGIEEAAEEIGNVETEIFDGEFNAAVQFSQAEDIAAGGRFDAIIITPNDTVGIAPALADAAASGLVVATTLFPVGPELDNMEPQVEGLTTTVAANPAVGAQAKAEKVVEFCADKDPCRVVILIGQLIYPFDNLRYDTFQRVLGEHDNIEIVATGEGNYSPDTSLTAMQDILQANPEIDAILSNADQHPVGAEIALEDAGIDVEPIYMIGGGLNQITVDAIREGRVDATLTEMPASMGAAALEAVVATLRGEEASTWVDSTKLSDVPMIVDKAWLDAHPEFTAEWEG